MYTAGPGGVTDPVLINSTEESIAAEKKERGEKPKQPKPKSLRKYVVLEYLKKPQRFEPPLKRQKTENGAQNGVPAESGEQNEAMQKALELIPKVQEQKLGGTVQSNSLSTA